MPPHGGWWGHSMIASADKRHGAAQDKHTDRAPSAPSACSETPAAPHPLEPLLHQIAMLRAFALHYVEVQKDATKAAIRRLVVTATFALLAAIVGGTILIVSAAMIADGLAELVSWALGSSPWVGKLVVGGGVLVTLALAGWILIYLLKRAQRKRVLRKYESLHNAQRAKFGTDVSQRAAL